MNLPISLILRDAPRRNRTRSPYLPPQFELAAFKVYVLGIQKQKSRLFHEISFRLGNGEAKYWLSILIRDIENKHPHGRKAVVPQNAPITGKP